MPRAAALQLDPWPDLPLEAWSETYATLHLFTQIVGKVRLAQSPWVNHSWHVTLYVTARGLTTSPIPYGARAFQIEFDFVDHELRVLSSGVLCAPRGRDGKARTSGDYLPETQRGC